MCKKKFKFMVNYVKWTQQPGNFHYKALKALKML